jgi:hypothetical protein
LKIWNLKVCDLIFFVLGYEDILEAFSSQILWLEYEASHAAAAAAKVNALSFTPVYLHVIFLKYIDIVTSQHTKHSHMILLLFHT